MAYRLTGNNWYQSSAGNVQIARAALGVEVSKIVVTDTMDVYGEPEGMAQGMKLTEGATTGVQSAQAGLVKLGMHSGPMSAGSSVYSNPHFIFQRETNKPQDDDSLHFLYQAQNDQEENIAVAKWSYIMTDVSDGSEDGKAQLSLKQGAVVEPALLLEAEGDNLRMMDDKKLAFGDSDEVTLEYDEDGIDTLLMSHTSATTDAVVDLLALEMQTSGTVANDFGAGISVRIEDAGGVEEQAGIDFQMTHIAPGGEDCDIVFQQMSQSKIRETLRLKAGHAADRADILLYTAHTAVTNSIVDMMRLRLNATDTAANDLGGGLAIHLENDTGQLEERASFHFVETDVSNGAEDCDIIFNQSIAGARTERLRLDADGPIAFVGPMEITNDDEVDGIVDILTLTHSSSDDNATVGDGAGLVFELENATGTSTVEEWGSIDVLSADITDAAEEGDMAFNLMTGGVLLQKLLLNSDGLSLLSGSLEIANKALSGTTALVVDNDDTDQIAIAVEAANIDADVTQVTADALTSALVMDVTADALVDGGVINLTSTSNVMTSAEMLTINHAATAITAAKTGDGIDIDFNRTLAAGAQTDNYNAMSLVRTSATSAAVTITAQGTVMYLENADDPNAGGTTTDSVDVLAITQDAGSTGQAIQIAHNGADNGITMMSASDAATSSLQITNTAGGYGINVSRNLAAADTDSPLVYINDDGAGDQATLHIHTDAVGDATARALLIDADAMTTQQAVELTADALSSGIGANLTSSSTALTTNGRVLQVTHSADFNDAGGYIAEISGAFTTGRGLNIVNDSIVDGFLTHINSSSTVLDTTGRLFIVDHTGNATAAQGAIAEIASAAADNTTIFKVTASAALAAGVALDLDLASMTSGTALDISNLAAFVDGKGLHIDATGTTQTTGILAHIDSAGTIITGVGRLFLVDHTAATTNSGTLSEFKTIANDETILTQWTADSLTSGTAMALTADVLTTGFGANLTSSSTALTGAGRVLMVDHTGNATSSGTVAEFKTVAADETKLLQLTADAILTGEALNITTDAATQTTTKAINVDSTIADIDANKAGSHVTINSSRTKANVGSGANSDDYDVAAIARTSAQSGGVFTAASGSVLNLANAVTGTVGTDDAYLLEATNSVPGQATFKDVIKIAAETSHASHAANGFGLGITFHLENGTGITEEHASMDIVTTDVTNGAEDTDIVFRQMKAGAMAEGLRIDADGSLHNSSHPLPVSDPYKYSEYMNDFIRYTDYDVTNEWTLSQLGGATAVVTIMDDTQHGVLQITTGATTDNHGGQIQFTGANAAGEFVLLTASKRTYFEARVKLNAATEIDAFVGLCITDADLSGAVPAATDYVGFAKDDGDTNWDFVAAKDSSETEVAVVHTADTNWVTFSFVADGVTSITPYINGTAGTAISTAGSICNDENLCLSLVVINGDAVTEQNIQWDYIRVLQER